MTGSNLPFINITTNIHQVQPFSKSLDSSLKWKDSAPSYLFIECVSGSTTSKSKRQPKQLHHGAEAQSPPVTMAKISRFSSKNMNCFCLFMPWNIFVCLENGFEVFSLKKRLVTKLTLIWNTLNVYWLWTKIHTLIIGWKKFALFLVRHRPSLV